MRVTHVITRLIVGGAQENTIASVLGLRQMPGLEVNLISGRSTGPGGSLESHFAGERDLLTVLPEIIRRVNPWFDMLALSRLTRIFREQRPEIVHTHSGKAGILGRLAARRARVPVIVHTIHGPSFGPFQSAVANTILRAVERLAGRWTTHFVTVADAMIEQYLAAGIGHRENYTRIYSGFDLGPFLSAKNDATLRSRFRLTPDDVVIGKIARLFKLKGHDDLLDVASEMVRRSPSVKFLLVGDGEWRERLKRRVRDSGLERHIIFTGLVPPAEIAPLVGCMDMLVHLSYREGLPRALPQAMAAGKPVIAYDSDGAREVCREGETGFLIRPGDTRALVDRASQLACDAALGRRLGRAGREFVRNRFTVELMVDQLHALYLRLRQS